MQKSNSILSGIKYVYLIFFFALLSGLFYPLIEEGANANLVIAGMFILFVGFVGAWCLYRASTLEKKQRIFFIAGFTILTIALLLVYAVIGRL